jgi:hypothetical protein
VGLGETYEAAHAQLAYEAVEAARVAHHHGTMLHLPEPSRQAAYESYLKTAERLLDGLEAVLRACADSDDPQEQTIYRLWAGE